MVAAIQPMTSMQNVVRPPVRRDDQPETVKGLFEDLCKKFENIYRPTRLARYYQWARMECYIRGQQLIWYNPSSQRLEALDDDETDLYFINNIVLPFIENVCAEYTKSRPKFSTYSETGSNPKIRAAMDNADYLMSCWSDSLWTPEELQRESKLVQCRTRLYSLTEFDDTAGPMIDVPQFQQQMSQLPAGVQSQYMAAMGMTKRRAGAIRSKAVDAFKVKVYDRRYTPEESPYLEYEDYELDAVLCKRYKHLNKLPAKKAPDPMSGLMFLRQLETAIGNTGEADAQMGMSAIFSGYYGDTSSMIDEVSSIHTQTWFEPYMYEDYVTGDKPEDPFNNGDVIPPRTRLGEKYPDGVNVSKINGEGVALENDAKNDKWSGYLFMVSASGHYGIGQENLMAQQEFFTETGSLIISSAMYSSQGITVANSGRIKGGKVRNQAGMIVEIEDMRPDEKLDQFLQHYTTQGIDPVLMKLPDFLKESMQFTSGARNAQVSGAPGGEGLNTARGVQNMAATADSAAAMKLELRAANLARRMEQALKIWQKRQQYPRYFGRFNETSGRWLRAVDIPYELRVRYEPDSHEPRTNMDKRQDLVSLVQLLAAAPQIPPPIVKAAVRLFAPDLELDSSSKWEVVGQQRLDAMDEAEGQAGQRAMALMNARRVPDVHAQQFAQQESIKAMLQAAAPDVLLDDHQALVQFYRDFYLSDDYKNSSPAKQEAIHQLVQMHEAGGVLAQQKDAAQQVEASAPIQQAQAEQEQAGQAASQQADQQAQTQQVEQERESQAQQATQEHVGQIHEAIQGEAERGHQASEADAARQHEKQMAQHEEKMQKDQQGHDERMAKMQKKPSEK